MPVDAAEFDNSCHYAPPQAARAPDEILARIVLCALLVFAFLGLAVGAYAFGPYLAREHRRLETWKVPLVWIGDATVLAWFLCYFRQHFLLGEPLQDNQASRIWTLGLVSMFIGLGSDFVITLYQMHTESVAYAISEEAQVQITEVKRQAFAKGMQYRFVCRFVDKTGVGYTAMFTASDTDGKWSPPLPRDITAGLLLGRVPLPIDVLYDPSWPDRNWPKGAGWDNGDRLHYFSLCILTFQVISLPLFLEALRRSAAAGVIPWWHDLHKAFPLLIEAAFWLLFGTLDLFVQRLA